MGLLDGKVALISGAARGQGAAEGRMFVEAGARVVLGDVLDAEGEALAADLGEAARYLHLDVTNENDWSAAVTEATTAFGRLDILINNAGIFRLAPLESVESGTGRVKKGTVLRARPASLPKWPAKMWNTSMFPRNKRSD